MAALHFSEEDDMFNRIGDIILISTWPKVFNLYKRKINIGWHGYDPALVKDMHAIFYGWGPMLKRKRIASFENVHVYPLVAEMLQLPYTHKIDGKLEVLKPILRKN